jgi:hypothetical protein
MMLERYWPKASEVNACIKNEAETADVSVLLAVHQPSALVKKAVGTDIETPATEKDLLDAFLTDNVPGGYLLVPITGPSGVGKSHIIRWLDAQLQRSAKSDDLHIIRIPKSASLRTVVELVLAPLADDPRYAKAREDLTRAVSEVNLKDAVVTFRAHLENALTAKQERIIGEIREHPDRTHLKSLVGHARMLPKLFSDAALDQHFVENVLSRVVARTFKGRSEAEESDETLSQFTSEDLILPREIELAQAAKPVRDYYLTQLAVSDTSRLQPVIDLLNEVVDAAIGNLFQLEQSTGGMTLQDIILAVREILFQDRKDLVLLVEDFAALAGIQDVLLKVCIHEGEYEGRKVRATMRTAIALTDGYLAFRETILTRAQRLWVIGDRQQTDQEIKSGVVEMVGGYLNAARWGEDELRRLFKLRGPTQSLINWLPAWRDDNLDDNNNEAVSAFGFDAKGGALFPFNRHAIEQLVDRHLMDGGKLIFNPRRVINEILRGMLLLRPSFEAHIFPPPDLQDLRPNAFLANWIRQTHQPEPTRRRLAALLTIWGGNAADIAAISHIPPAIFTTFDLPTPADLANIPFVQNAPPPTQSTPEGDPSGASQSTPPTTPAAEADPRIVAWQAKLDAWASGKELAHSDANEIRKALAGMLKDAVNWPSLRIRDQEIKPTWIKIPLARGNQPTGRQLQLCDSHVDEDGTVRAGILGALRFTVFKNERWNYSEGDDDYVASAALVDHLLSQLTPLLVDDARTQASMLSRTLFTQSRIAGLDPAVRPSGADAVLSGLFARPEPREVQAFEENWDKLRSTALGFIGAKPAREVLQTELLARAGSFQGSGSKAYALDIARLLDTLGGDAATSDTMPEGLAEEIKTFIRPIAEGRLWGQLQSVIGKLRTFRGQLADFIDDSFDKAAFVVDIQEIIRLLTATATWPANTTFNMREFERRLTEFQTSPIVDLVTKTEIIVDEADRTQIPKLLNALGSIDLGLIDRTMTFLSAANSIIASAEQSVAREEAVRNQINPKAVAKELLDLLRMVAGGSVEAVGSVQ